MICSYCGTDLPSGAMFCGECGRPVAARPIARSRSTATPSSVAPPARWPVTVAEHKPDAPADVPDKPARRAASAGAPAHALVEPPHAADAVFDEPPPSAIKAEATARAAAKAEAADKAATEARELAAAEAAAFAEAKAALVAEKAEAVRAAASAEAESRAAAEAAAEAAADEARAAEAERAEVERLAAEALPVVEAAAEESAAPAVQDAVPEGVELCAQCGSPLAASDIFCGVCGFVRKTVALKPRREDSVVAEAPAQEDSVVAESSAQEDSVVAEPPAQEDSVGAQATGAEDSAAAAASRPNDTVAYDPFPWGLPRASDIIPVELAPAAPDESYDDDSDVEKTRIVDRSVRGDRFVLQFSTGESVSVSGTGLIGRNPLAEPGEYFDSLVTIVDPGKSVSKTHLEFGQDAGAFWVSDRYSANGTIVREPDRPARRGDAGKRYRVVRGTRIDIGEQFFIVS